MREASAPMAPRSAKPGRHGAASGPAHSSTRPTSARIVGSLGLTISAAWDVLRPAPRLRAGPPPRTWHGACRLMLVSTDSRVTMRRFCLLVLAMIAASAGVRADVVQLGASGSGWCTRSGGCNNVNQDFINNHFVDGGQTYRHWFSFDIPDFGSDAIIAATLSIWNDLLNRSGPGTFLLVEAAGPNYTAFGSGATIGSIPTNTAYNGTSHYVDIELNALGVSLLDVSQGTEFLFGGRIEGGTANTELFGYTTGLPAGRLSIETASVAVADVSEPATLALLSAGLLGVRWARRHARRRKNS
jgi:hypothetical protein